MRMGRVLMGAMLVLMPSILAAQAVETSLRPVLRPAVIEAKFTQTSAPFASLRPKMRPVSGRSATASAVQKVVVEQTISADITARKVTKTEPLRNVVAQTHTGVVTVTSPFAVAKSLRPKKRPRKLKVVLLDTSKPGRVKKAVKYRKKGLVCGINGLRGYHVKRISGKGGCGVANPVKLTEVDGVKMTREVSIGCDTAKAFYSWIQKGAKPAVGKKGGGLAKVQVIGGYACRNRNSAKGGRLSEHAKGNALDIGGFVLKDGTTMSVLKGWRSRAHGSTLKRMHKKACGPFKTVLGPNANRFHQDHFHFDVAKHRGGGTYCR
jgi:hypothetical protein